MDLDNFEGEGTQGVVELPESILGPRDALDLLDRVWYAQAGRAARWMDLLGDYAGTELFVIDGESLIQHVLNDRLMKIGRDNDPTFSILHALFVVERTLKEFVDREANFEIVFWSSTRYSTIQTGSSPYTVASRLLARKQLFDHLVRQDIPIHVFEDLSDPSWQEYRVSKKPMFVLSSDGGSPANSATTSTLGYVLVQRVHIFDLLSSGITVASLVSAEFRDSTVMSFVFEQRLNAHARRILPENFWAYVRSREDALEFQLLRLSGSGLKLQQVPFDSAADDEAFAKALRAAVPEPSENYFTVVLLWLFIAHTLIVKNLSVFERSLRVDLSSETGSSISQFLTPVYIALASSNVCVHVDGRVFSLLISYVTDNTSRSLNELLGEETVLQVNRIWSRINYDVENVMNMNVLHKQFNDSLPVRVMEQTPMTFHSLLPFDNDVLNRELSEVNVEVSNTETLEPTSSSNFSGSVVFTDLKHWHNSTKSILPPHLGGERLLPLTDKQKKLVNTKRQNFMGILQLQASSLVGASGGALQQISIPPVSSQSSGKSRKDKKTEKKSKSTKAELIRLQNIDNKKMKESGATADWWKEQLRAMKQMPLSRQLAYLDSLFRNPRAQSDFLAAEIRLFRIDCLLHQWIMTDSRDTPETNDVYTRSIMRLVKELLDKQDVSNTIIKKLTSVVQALGFEKVLSLDARTKSATDDRKLCFHFIKLASSRKEEHEYPFMRIKESPTHWQLRMFGEYMDRSLDSSSDERVSFQPDRWQKRVLDCIDANKSLLVVAPTSAGKTFISFYAMEKVLRQSDDGILVYVAPTKALVSQIAAEVYARFSKNLRSGSLWAVHSRDYRVNEPQACQILITVPEILSIMLLSPPLARHWTPRIKRIILDEIHSIGQQEGGSVWEQIILMAPSPVIGLSATVGSPQIFSDWLSQVQAAHGYEYEFIEHPHRYSHLRKFFYLLDGHAREFDSLHSHTDTKRSCFLHPASFLSLERKSIPSDLSFEARDTLSLFGALREEYPVDKLKGLDPETYFHDCKGFIRQQDVLIYEASLKRFLESCMTSSQSTTLNRVIEGLADSRLSSEKVDRLVSRDVFLKNLIFMLSDLHNRNELPALLFHFDRTGCEIMARFLMEDLVDAETRWKESSPEWENKLRQWNLWKLREKDRARQAERDKHRSPDPDAPLESPSVSWESTFDPDYPLEAFSFAAFNAYSKYELEEAISDLKWRKATPHWALDALKRGIGVHHAGMNKRYRSLIEALFRKGYLRVMIATGTLALGINAPAKTSVFCGDSVYLTALMYRQCSGRAGRRGFDLLGNVVFYGIPMDRVRRLVLSKLPSLQGHFPLTSTLTLRLMNLLEGSGQSDVAKKSIKGILSLPQISFGSSIGRHQLLHHLRFSIEYLRRFHLIDRNGRPMNLYAIGAHLYYTEPNNFALIVLLKEGLLHRISAMGSQAAQNEFILLMSHLFGRKYLPASYSNSRMLEDLRSRYPSEIVLPELSRRIRKLFDAIMRHHERDTIDIFRGYAYSYATAYAEIIGPDTRLPLSNQDFSGDNADHSPFRTYLGKMKNDMIVRSAFVATSGHTDASISSVSELQRTARDGLHMNADAVPRFSHLLDNGNDQSRKLNAYIYDFFNHGQDQTLISANGIRRGDLWYVLQDFSLTLAAVKAALGELFLNTSREASDELLSDSGYGSNPVDPAEAEMDDEDEDGDNQEESTLRRPVGVNAGDWAVYRMVCDALEEFNRKFKDMWA